MPIRRAFSAMRGSRSSAAPTFVIGPIVISAIGSSLPMMQSISAPTPSSVHAARVSVERDRVGVAPLRPFGYALEQLGRHADPDRHVVAPARGENAGDELRP